MINSCFPCSTSPGVLDFYVRIAYLPVTEEREVQEPLTSRKLLKILLQVVDSSSWNDVMEHLCCLPWDPGGFQRTQGPMSKRSLQSVIHVWQLESCHLAAYPWGWKWAHRIYKLLQKEAKLLSCCSSVLSIICVPMLGASIYRWQIKPAWYPWPRMLLQKGNTKGLHVWKTSLRKKWWLSCWSLLSLNVAHIEKMRGLPLHNNLHLQLFFCFLINQTS